MKCPACKATLSDSFIWCPYCGRTPRQAQKLSLRLDLGLTAALLAFIWAAWMWLEF
jgi:hypothetical protein